jgi:hypothetical protein
MGDVRELRLVLKVGSRVSGAVRIAFKVGGQRGDG